MLQGICYYGNNIRQIGHVISIESLHTISANQISISDFCQGTWQKIDIPISLANCLTYIKILCQGTIESIIWEHIFL